MMSQKEAPRKNLGASWVLPRKVAKMAPLEFLFYLVSLVEYDGCFLGASYYVLSAEEGST